jgi:hypothetical protein
MQVLAKEGNEVYRDELGVRITLPAGQGNLPHAGLVRNLPIPGDFEITLSYEVR